MGAVDSISYISHLECSQCQVKFDSERLQTYCRDCRAPLLVRYDLDEARRSIDREELRRRRQGMWRWHELLPVRAMQHIITLGEGDTPLLPAANVGRELGLKRLFIKEEALNPTGSFKARGLSAAVSKAYELGASNLTIPTAGNAGGALAAYAARAGIHAHIFMPSDTPYANQAECTIMDAQVTLVNGLISDAAAAARAMIDQEGTDRPWFDVSTFKEPYRTEGKKVMAYELAERFNWDLPEVLIYPTGGGTGLVGMWKAFEEMESLGWVEPGRRPRMVAVQASGCAPVVKAFESGAETCEFWHDAQTIASGLRVPASFADRLILSCLRDSRGAAIAVTDEEINAAQRQLASNEGLFAAPEGAATLAALLKLAAAGWVKPDERIVLFNTGSGLKYL